MANFHRKNGVQTHGHILNFLLEDCQPLYAASNLNCTQLDYIRLLRLLVATSINVR